MQCITIQYSMLVFINAELIHRSRNDSSYYIPNAEFTSASRLLLACGPSVDLDLFTLRLRAVFSLQILVVHPATARHPGFQRRLPLLRHAHRRRPGLCQVNLATAAIASTVSLAASKRLYRRFVDWDAAALFIRRKPFLSRFYVFV